VLSDSRAQSVLRWAILALAPLLLVAGLVL